jgi:hypothetical protein
VDDIPALVSVAFTVGQTEVDGIVVDGVVVVALVGVVVGGVGVVVGGAGLVPPLPFICALANACCILSNSPGAQM